MSRLVIPTAAELWSRLAAEDALAQVPLKPGTRHPHDPRRGVSAVCPEMPLLPDLKPVASLPMPNASLLRHFLNWLHLAGYSAVGRLVYGHSVRLVFSVTPKDWRDFLDDDIERARASLVAARLTTDAHNHLGHGVDTFAGYLRLRQQRYRLSHADLMLLTWPATQPITLLTFFGDEPVIDSAQSGCLPSGVSKRRVYVKSGPLPRPLRESLSLSALPLLPIKRWLPSNQAFHQHFRAWLHVSGYSASALFLYGLAARIAFSLWRKDWREIDPVADIARVRAWIAEFYPSTATRDVYAKGLTKLSLYLQRRQANALSTQPKPPPPPRPPRRSTRYPAVSGQRLPEAIERSLEAFRHHLRRNWPPAFAGAGSERADEIAADWWAAITRPLRKMRAAGVSIEVPADLTPARWYAYVDARRANGISPHTLNGELTLLRGWLWWLTDDEQPICARMLKVRPLRTPARLPKDLPPERLRTLQRVIERESQHPEPHLHRRGLMDLAWFLLMLHSGLRTGEVRRLLPDEIDWERRLIRIIDSKGLRSRMAPFSTQVADALNTWLAIRGESRELPACVFIDRGLPLSGSYCYSRLQLYGERCGVRAHPHQLRHTCATLLLNTGMPLPQVQALLGHQKIQTTRDYARSFDGVVAADYTRAMLSLERDLGLTPSGESMPTAAQIVALLDGLRTTGVLNPRQLDDLAEARAGLLHLSALAAETKAV